MGNPHKHAELIKAKADGHKIQYSELKSDTWFDMANTDWDFDQDDLIFRIKPEAPKYPQTRMTENELAIIVGEHHPFANVRPSVYKALANAVLARACEDGDVITIEESRKRSAAAVCASQEGMVHESLLKKVGNECFASGVRWATGRTANKEDSRAIVDAIIASVKEKKDA